MRKEKCLLGKENTIAIAVNTLFLAGYVSTGPANLKIDPAFLFPVRDAL